MTTRDIVLVALFAAIIVVLGMLPPITLGFIPVPITAQSLGVMLAGCILGAKRGAAAVLLVVLLVAIGLPVLSGGRGGLAVFAGPTAGYLVGWVAGAYVTGLIAERLVREGQPEFQQFLGFLVAAVVGGIGIVYLFGIAWLCYMSGKAFIATTLASLVFIPGDLIKAFVAMLAGRAVLAGYPLLPVRT
ncbi:biotin transport system substrate-specific component [Mycoplana sp. BE70]|uniref:biotin transporter BioY n=1 Tax=Mycoplana sp. BE70 TaxID=2817775 RepID=UPI002865401C|nr:biotin transporter BioY [Mycoplana sp. BE70]MDR6756160.1 biotin transport system substrate-specific component [Mycoplana sp. BE70]